VAAGRVDVYWEIALKEYDVAAGALIASEAGAAVLDMNGGTNYPSEGILCTNEPLVPVMLEHFKAAIGHVEPTPA
jgi:myo-inositol-1(or 4)-monophosphatase